MPTDHRAKLAAIKTFESLLGYLRDELDWPVGLADFEDDDELYFEFSPEELGIDAANAAKIQRIQRLRPLAVGQPWGIFFVEFEPKKLPVVALRRILSRVALKKRASANSAERTAWAADDLLFVSNYGTGDERRISLAHFSQPENNDDVPTLKVLGWDNLDTPLHLDDVADKLARLAWPENEHDLDDWRSDWRSAFTLRHREVINTSRELSVRLAELARTLRNRIQTALKIETENGTLTKLMKAFQTSLIHDLDPDGFADMYAQTIAYGLLTARIANPKGITADHLHEQMPVTNPFLKELMETFLHVGGRRGRTRTEDIDFDELGISEVVELLDDANMEAIVRDFGDRNPQEDPVIHFYELFLKEYDAKQRMKRGVFYTPRPVVSYIVRSVDELLRTEFGLEDGLADITTWAEMTARNPDIKIPVGVDPDQPFVQILDPATGTGTFLVEVIDLIHKTLVAKWEAEDCNEQERSACWNDYVPKYLLPRLHGYELLMAPYAIAHLKIGLKLFETGYRFGSHERARVYLTNALEPASDEQYTLDVLPALAHEAAAVNEIKRKQRFTVVIGNPPYSNFGKLNKIPFILDLLNDYKHGLHERKINLDDDFIKFVRLAHFHLAQSELGVLGLITNNVFIDGLTHRRMREALLESFSRIAVLDLHGNSAAQEAGRDGAKDENVFDITLGVCITTMCRSGNAVQSIKQVSFSELRGNRQSKYNALLAHTETPLKLRPVDPYFFFTPKDFSKTAEYMSFVSLMDVFSRPAYGIQTKRDALTISFDDKEVLSRANDLLVNDDSAVRQMYGLPADGRDWTVGWARADLARLEDIPASVRCIMYRPFDWRWTVYTDKSKGFLAYPRWETMSCMLSENLALIAMRQVFQDVDVYSHFGVTDTLIDERTFYSNRGGTYLFPLYASREHGDLLRKSEKCGRHNFKGQFMRELEILLGLHAHGAHEWSQITPEDIFHYIFAAFSGPTFRTRYVDMLKIDFPRVPLTSNLGLFRELSQRGNELSSLYTMKSPWLNNFITIYTGPKSPEVKLVGWSNNTVWLDAGKTNAREGHRATVPGTIGFHGVPEAVWDFHNGGYQVCHKWLKDRKGRTLSDEDIAHYQKIVVALNETMRIMKEIDEVIEAHGGWPGAFQASDQNTDATATAGAKALPFERMEPTDAEKFKTCVPLVTLKAAAGGFGDSQEVDAEDWVKPNTTRKLSPGMFVAQVVGKSMEPLIFDGAYCLFRYGVEGTRQGKIVLVQHHAIEDPETGGRYTVKRYTSEKTTDGSGDWRHTAIRLLPENPDFEPIVVDSNDSAELQVSAEMVEVLGK